MEEKEFTITVFSENYTGLLNHITIVFTRRKINIDSIIASETEVKGIYRHTIVVSTTDEQVEKVVKQLEKIVEVIKALAHTEEKIVHREIALYKISNRPGIMEELEQVMKGTDAKIIFLDSDYIVIEKTGHKAETQDLFEKLKPFGVREFARSGRVAINKPMLHLSHFLEEIEKNEVFNVKP
ncbi:MAG: acetolactate synthase small subunit [Candidatus Cyclobacteriaceae bacterium M3_2C_046]